MPPLLIDPQARIQFELLTERFMDIAIEILNGDPDLEPSGDELEDGDGA